MGRVVVFHTPARLVQQYSPRRLRPDNLGKRGHPPFVFNRTPKALTRLRPDNLGRPWLPACRLWFQPCVARPRSPKPVFPNNGA